MHKFRFSIVCATACSLALTIPLTICGILCLLRPSSSLSLSLRSSLSLVFALSMLACFIFMFKRDHRTICRSAGVIYGCKIFYTGLLTTVLTRVFLRGSDKILPCRLLELCTFCETRRLSFIRTVRAGWLARLRLIIIMILETVRPLLLNSCFL